MHPDINSRFDHLFTPQGRCRCRRRCRRLAVVVVVIIVFRGYVVISPGGYVVIGSRGFVIFSPRGLLFSPFVALLIFRSFRWDHMEVNQAKWLHLLQRTVNWLVGPTLGLSVGPYVNWSHLNISCVSVFACKNIVGWQQDIPDHCISLFLSFLLMYHRDPLERGSVCPIIQPDIQACLLVFRHTQLLSVGREHKVYKSTMSVAQLISVAFSLRT